MEWCSRLFGLATTWVLGFFGALCLSCSVACVRSKILSLHSAAFARSVLLSRRWTSKLSQAAYPRPKRDLENAKSRDGPIDQGTMHSRCSTTAMLALAPTASMACRPVCLRLRSPDIRTSVPSREVIARQARGKSSNSRPALSILSFSHHTCIDRARSLDNHGLTPTPQHSASVDLPPPPHQPYHHNHARSCAGVTMRSAAAEVAAVSGGYRATLASGAARADAITSREGQL